MCIEDAQEHQSSNEQKETAGGRHEVYVPPETGIGQVSSVMLLQKTQVITTARRVKSVSNKAPLILPLVPWHMCVLITYWKICPMAKRRAAPKR